MDPFRSADPAAPFGSGSAPVDSSDAVPASAETLQQVVLIQQRQLEELQRSQQQFAEFQQRSVEAQSQQVELLHRGILTAQQTASAAMDVAMTRQSRSGTVSDFRKLRPSVFTGTEGPLEAEQWLIDTANLLVVARIPERDRVEVVKIQLADVARDWWTTEEERLEQPVSWDQFSTSFYERFFPKIARRQLEQHFIGLQQ